MRRLAPVLLLSEPPPGAEKDALAADLTATVYSERAVAGRPTYQRHFEHFVRVLKGIPFEDKIERLGRVPPA